MSKVKFQEVNINLPKDTIKQIEHMGELLNIKNRTRLIVNSIELALFVHQVNLTQSRKVVIQRKNGKRNVLTPDINPVKIKLPEKTIKQIREIESLTNIDLATHTIINAVSLAETVFIGIVSEGTQVFVEDENGKRDDLTIEIK